MARYINADALMKKLNEDPIGQTIVQRYNIDGFIEAFPTADVVEVKHGRWNWQGPISVGGWVCSECKHKFYQGYGNENFCPNCGADMREETEDGRNN